MNHLADAISPMDGQSHLVYANNAECKSLGYIREEFATLTPADIDPDLDFYTFDDLIKTLFEKDDHRNIERRHRARDERIYPVEISITEIEFTGAIHAFIMSGDVTERKRME